MLFVWIGLALVLIVFGVPFLVGRFLPADYEARVEATLSRPPGDVWAEMADFEAHPMTGRQMRRVEELDDDHGKPVWIEHLRGSWITVRTVAFEEPTHFVREMEDSVVPIKARTEVSLAKAGEGCTVALVHQTHIAEGTWHVPFFRFVMYVTRGAAKMMKDYLAGVARGLDAEIQFRKK